MREDVFKVTHSTSILPLRWIANGIFSKVSHWAMLKAIYLDENNSYSWNYKDLRKYKFYIKIYTVFDKPYQWWGSWYTLDKDYTRDLLNEVAGFEWDDYDENGIPYWDYLWHEDPITGDAWRLLSK